MPAAALSYVLSISRMFVTCDCADKAACNCCMGAWLPKPPRFGLPPGAEGRLLGGPVSGGMGKLCRGAEGGSWGGPGTDVILEVGKSEAWGSAGLGCGDSAWEPGRAGSYAGPSSDTDGRQSCKHELSCLYQSAHITARQYRQQHLEDDSSMTHSCMVTHIPHTYLSVDDYQQQLSNLNCIRNEGCCVISQAG